MQRRASFVMLDFTSDSGQHIAGVEALIHLHDRNSGLFITRQDRALNRSRSAPSRQ